MLSSSIVSALAFPERRWPWLARLIGEARRRQRRRQLTIAGFSVAAIAVAASLYVGLAGWGSASSAAGRSTAAAQGPVGSAVFAPPIADTLDSGNLPAAGPMTLADGSLWVNSPDPATVYSPWTNPPVGVETVSRVDPATGRVSARIDLGHPGGGDITSGFGSIWAVNRTAAVVTRISPDTNTVVATIPAGPSPVAIAAGRTGVWIANEGRGSPSSGASLVEIDPANNRVSTRLRLAAPPVWLVGAAGSIWVAGRGRRAIVRVDPATGRFAGAIASSPIGARSRATADARGDLWFSSGGKAKPRLLRLDPRTRTVTTVLSERALARYRLQNVDALAADGRGWIWLSGYCGPGSRPYAGLSLFCLLRVNPATNRVTLLRAIRGGNAGREPERFDASLAYDGRTVWFSLYGGSTVLPVNPRLIVVCGPYRWHGAGLFASDCRTKKP